MGCFSCFDSSKADFVVENGDKIRKDRKPSVAPHVPRVSAGTEKLKPRVGSVLSKETSTPEDGPEEKISATTFTFRELAAATENFKQDCLLGEGGFGKVYKGRLESTGQVVAVKQLNRDGLQGNREFLVEVLMLSLLHHPNLVNLIGYCAEGDQRLLVLEYMPFGSLEDHLHDLLPDKEPLDWNIRMKIAAGAAKGLEYLHHKANPPVIYRDFKSSNILLDEGFHPKLSDFGLAKLGPTGDKSHVSTRVMGTYGYCAPEYAMTGQLTVKSDVYSFGVVLLELITGRKALDSTKTQPEQSLVKWARPLLHDRRQLPKMADPRLEGQFPKSGFIRVLSVAGMCIHEQAASRPNMGEVVTALSFLAAKDFDPKTAHSHRCAKDERGRGGEQAASRPNMGEVVTALSFLAAKDFDPKTAHSHRWAKDERGRGGEQAASRPNMGEVVTALSFLAAKDFDPKTAHSHRWAKDERGRGGGYAEDRGKTVKNEEAVASSIKWELDELDGDDSPKEHRNQNRDFDRERAVAEAKMWGENWRDKKKLNSWKDPDNAQET